ncbi:MAG TPA: acyl carrier protein [Verrucomicrobiales bacterium]|jgi:acyl carrier protein|nr:acyl carrier protein [Verrucomicrobiales bacterium]
MKTELPPPMERLQCCLPRTADGADAHSTLESLQFDSLDTVEFLCAVHEEFGVRLTSDDLFPGQTVQGLLTCIMARSSEPQTLTVP